MPKKARPAQRRPFYKSPPPKPERGIHSASTSERKPTPKRTEVRAPVTTSADLHATPVATAPFVLREDGEIETFGVPSRLGVDGPDRLKPELQTSPSTLPKLVYHDDARKVWLYLGNSLELLDAIAAQYPDGRFDCIFADPPYFLSNGGPAVAGSRRAHGQGGQGRLG